MTTAMIHRVATLFVLIFILVAPATADDSDSLPYYKDVIVIHSAERENFQIGFPFFSTLETDIIFQECIPAKDIVVGGVSMVNLTDAEFAEYSDMDWKNSNSMQVHLEDGLLSAILSVMDLKYYLITQGDVPMEALNTLPANNFAYDESQDRYFQLSVPDEKQHLWIDLNWAGRDVAYKLTVFSPDAVMGPFEDSDDGKIDQRIYLDISASKYLTAGMWYYQVTNLNGGYSNFNFTNYY
ncbi:hypothetical protein [Methanogenium sp. MK-MG]|uniref:hypothetical protein n=1 Tax=Methanogenium sp. MK-MG TaxID=2599926 RepID=UPI0013EB084D|nr:hypothetical protein [Methanogenium sp. MK-MG]KAF1077242.1 hypothetical protein MKMG_01321 [Methanogenium sp. MK-MG]